MDTGSVHMLSHCPLHSPLLWILWSMNTQSGQGGRGEECPAKENRVTPPPRAQGFPWWRVVKGKQGLETSSQENETWLHRFLPRGFVFFLSVFPLLPELLTSSRSDWCEHWLLSLQFTWVLADGSVNEPREAGFSLSFLLINLPTKMPCLWPVCRLQQDNPGAGEAQISSFDHISASTDMGALMEVWSENFSYEGEGSPTSAHVSTAF